MRELSRRYVEITSSKTSFRLAKVFAANLFNQLVTIIVQTLLVPILLLTLGTHLYGIWLLISAIPAYLMFSDLGFTMVAKTRMIMQVSADDRDSALKIFQSVFLLLNAVTPILLVVSIIIISFIDIGHLIGASYISNFDARLTLVILIANVILYQYFMLIGAGVRSENRVATEQIWVATSRLSDGFFIGITAFFSHNLVYVAASSLASRAAFTVVMYIVLRIQSPWIYLGYTMARWDQVRALWSPASSFMVITLSQGLLIQAPIIVVGTLFGPAQVVVFSTARTVARVGTTISYFMNGSMSAELSRLYGRKEFALLAAVVRLNIKISVFIALFYGAAIFTTRNFDINLFTHGRVQVPTTLFTLIIIAVLAEMMWVSISSPLMAINRHIRVGYLLVVFSALGVVSSYPLGKIYGISGVAFAVVAVQAAMLVLCLREVYRIPGLRDNGAQIR